MALEQFEMIALQDTGDGAVKVVRKIYFGNPPDKGLESV